MKTLIFSHANSFPAGTYEFLFQLLKKRGFHVLALDKFGHNPRYPVTSNWPYLVQELADFVQSHIHTIHGSLYFVGHSLGGYLSIMTAALHPKIGRKNIDGVLLIDSPLLSGWKAHVLQLVKQTQLIHALPPGKISRRRRYIWQNSDEVLTHFQKKPTFSNWHPQVLFDYVQNATHEETTLNGSQRILSFSRDIETSIYNTLPHHLNDLLIKNPLRCPVSFLGGDQSKELKQVGLKLTEKITQGRINMLKGSHLFPMENPFETAAAIESALHQMKRAY